MDPLEEITNISIELKSLIWLVRKRTAESQQSQDLRSVTTQAVVQYSNYLSERLNDFATEYDEWQTIKKYTDIH